ncbi:MAG: sulfatase-like hydrolase/transferase [bacterium]|nr:sulfatase-like hydrolase/transferase [bacterium]
MPVSRRAFLQSTALGAVSAGWNRAEAAESPNIIWIIADDVGGGEVGCYGHPTLRTPNIDRLAAGGLKFTQAFVTTSSCSPSRASLFTGKYPHSTGAENLHDPLPADQVIVPELLSRAGYYSGSVGKYHLGEAAEKKLDSMKGDVRQWRDFMKERPERKPFFLALGFTDAHRPFDRGCIDPPYTHDEVIVPRFLPDIPSVREDLAGFYDEITRMDNEIGELLTHLESNGLLENTLIMFTGDNGMPFPRAKTTLYDIGTYTPLILHWPREIKAGGVYDGVVSLVDVAPASLQAAGVAVPDSMQGVSLLDQVSDPAHYAREYVFTEANWHDFDDHVRAARDSRFKYIRNAFPERPLPNSADSINTPMFRDIIRLRDEGNLTKEQMLMFRSRRAEEELYDLAYDPNEFHNLVYEPAYQSVLERMRARLDQWTLETADISPERALPDEFDRESGERIRRAHQLGQ